MKTFIELFNDSVKSCWNNPALSVFGREPMTYGDLAREICVLHQLWEKAGLGIGEKVCINAKSSANWMTTFMASVTGGYVSVQLFNGFTPADTQRLICHSDSRILYTEKKNFDGMNWDEMPELLAAIDCDTLELLASRNGFDALYASRYTDWDAKHPTFSVDDYCVRGAEMEDVCAIMYTSGSTGNPKGVMLNVKNFSANVELVSKTLPMYRGENHFSILPYAHIFGLTVDAITALSIGMHLCVLSNLPMPHLLEAAFSELKPRVFFAVPLVLAKYTEYILAEHLKNGERDFDQLHDIMMEAMGGRIEVFATGGAAIPPSIENLLAFQLKMPFITGYGMTETAPVISLGPVGGYKAKSCGQVPDGYIDVKINSMDPHVIPGEVMVRGDIVFVGYYKNEEATRHVLTEDGWLHTGDVGTIDEDRILFLSGRCKNMILRDNGQNIFPEEIEVVLNQHPYINESVVVQRESLIHAILVVNENAVGEAGLDANTLNSVMREAIKHTNSQLAAYSQINTFELRFEPFAKTPKGSIKRYMYM